MGFASIILPAIIICMLAYAMMVAFERGVIFGEKKAMNRLKAIESFERYKKGLK